jgi:hypothetical protein
MGQNFLDCDREQAFLSPPSLRDWLPEDHLAWFVIDSVAGMDLAGFCAAYRAHGHGRAAYEPSVMVALGSRAAGQAAPLVLDSWATGIVSAAHDARSSDLGEAPARGWTEDLAHEQCSAPTGAAFRL